MSKFTRYLDRPASVTTDVLVAVGVGVASLIVFRLVLPVIPLIGGLAESLAYPASGVIAAMTYHRARKNLIDMTPPFQG